MKVLVWLFLTLLGTAFAHSLSVKVFQDHISVPTTAESGYTEFALTNGTGDIYAHEIVKVKAGADPEIFRDGIIAFFSGKADEKMMGELMGMLDVFSGGAVGTAPGSSRSVGMVLTPGTYVVYADKITDTGLVIDKAHTAIVTVTEAKQPASAPTADYTIELGEYAFLLPETLEAGTHLVKFENSGKEDHLAFVFRLPDGMSEDEAMQRENPPIDWAQAQGVHALGSGAAAYALLTFEPGATYLFDCPIPNAEGKAHDEMGMMRFVAIPQN